MSSGERKQLVSPQRESDVIPQLVGSSSVPGKCQHRPPWDHHRVGTEQQEAGPMGPQVGELDKPGEFFRHSIQLGPREVWWCLGRVGA